MTARTPRRTVSRLPRAQRVRDIMDSARTVFSEKGYERAVIADIAARAGVVEGTIYKYFDSKRDLMFRVMAHWYESMLADYESDLAGIKGTRNRLRFVIWRHLKSVRDNPALCRVFFREIRVEDDYYQSLIHELNRRYTEFGVQIIREAIERGEIRADANIQLIRDMIYGGVEHHCWNYVSGRGELDIDEVADDLTDAALNGFGARLGADDDLVETASKLSALVERLERAVPGTAGAE